VSPLPPFFPSSLSFHHTLQGGGWMDGWMEKRGETPGASLLFSSLPVPSGGHWFGRPFDDARRTGLLNSFPPH